MLLIDTLKNRLAEYNYKKSDSGLINGISFNLVLRTAREKLRLLCVVAEVPENVVDIEDLQDFFERIRTSLTMQYAWSPSWKELGTFTILTCKHDLFVQIKGNEALFVDKTGFHSNVMLGTLFIDSDTFEHLQKTTWGLFYSGKHFKAIENEVTEWCQSQSINLNNGAD